MSDIHTLPVLPAADVFPMMPDDELDELAADIKANGLREPLVLADVDGETVLVDGRNRRAACDRAGVEPDTRMLNGEDPTAYVLSANIHRRHMTKGQRAMAVAMVYPETRQGKKDTSPALGEVGREYLRKARAILSDASDLSDEVLAGTMSLDAAYDEVGRRTGKIRNARGRLAKLRDGRPDLADLVTNEAMSLDDAEAKAKADADALKQQRWAATVNLIDSVTHLDRDPDSADEVAAAYDPVVAESRGETVSPARLRRSAAYLTALADAMEAEQ